MSKVYKVIFEDENLELQVGENQTISNAMLGVNGAHPILGCRGGGCGMCRIKVNSGEYTTSRMSKQQVPDEDKAAGYSLACQTRPTSDLSVKYVGKKEYDGEVDNYFDSL